jgi:hypothetical protein
VQFATPERGEDNEDPMLIEKPFRATWGDFPDVLIFAGESAVKRHPEYPAAKAGDIGSAKRLAADLISAEAIASVARLVAGRDAILLPVHALEAGGVNRVPAAMAELLGERMRLEVEEDIVQSNTAGHTGASGWARLARPAVFDGEVASGRGYVLVDDFVGQGGTLANLRGYVLSGGAEAIGAATLTGKGYSAKLALSPQSLHSLRDRYETELESWWRQSFGYGFEELTESEARYLLRAENAHTIRDRIAQARSEAKP